MRLLCLDSSTAALTVALVTDGETAAAIDAEVGIRHGELLAPAVRDVLAASPGPLDGVAVGLGPGPFTSLRVGIATAAALADAHGVPAYGACSLDLLAGPDVVVVQDARRREVYWAAYGADGRRTSGPHVSAREPIELPPGLAVRGAGAVLLGLPEPPPHQRWPRAAALWGLVADRLGAGPGDRDVLAPLYLRRPDAQEQPARRPLPPDVPR